MMRTIHALFALAVFGAAFTLAPTASAETIALSGNCSYETSFGCSAQCNAGSINCNVQFIDQCSASCTATPTTTCTTACAKECATTGATFSCSGYCGDQCMSQCTSNGNYGADSVTACVTDCQGQCSYQCNLKPTTSCETECATSCTVTENIQCGVSCEVKDSASCSITPASCMTQCNDGSGAIICNGQVVYFAANITDAAAWYVSHLDAQFTVSATAMCSDGTCTGSIKAGGCDSSGAAPTSGEGLLAAGLAFLGVGAARRRRGRRSAARAGDAG